MKIAQAIAEYATLLRWLDKMEAELPRLTSRADLGALAALVGWVLESHAKREMEGSILPLHRALGRADHFGKRAPDYHALGRQLGEVRQAATRAQACRRLRAALRASREHFQEKERALFPAIERTLKSNDGSTLGQRFERTPLSRTKLSNRSLRELPVRTAPVDAPGVRRLPYFKGFEVAAVAGLGAASKGA
jgi:hypothetical protein